MARKTVHRVLLACRGVDARRIQRSAAEAEIETAGLVGESDDAALWPRDIDYTMFLSNPQPTADDVVGLALDAGCDLLHPGWGPLVRRGELAARAQAVGLRLVGPTHAHLELAADGARVRQLAAELELPVVPGSEPQEDLVDALGWLQRAGFPAAARMAQDAEAPWVRLATLEQAQQRLPGLLAQGPVILERHVLHAREIEVLVVGEESGEALTLGERDTSYQPHGLRLLVESPVASLSDEHALSIRKAAATLVSRLRWPGLVSVRFLLTPDGRGYLLRLRPGLQPWHAVTEAVLGVDLVDVQLRIALGERLGWRPHHLRENGHAFCLRVMSTHDQPAPLDTLELPDDLRVERGFEQGDTVLPGEEILQIIAHAPTRQAAIVRARAALDQIRIAGPSTNLDHFRRVFDLKAFWEAPLTRDQFDALL